MCLSAAAGTVTITKMKCELKTTSAEATEETAAKLGANLQGGEVIELVSDLGGGKTTFVRGLARGFGSSDRVGSPTFTVSKVYKAGSKELHHFDFYRLPEAGVVAHELHDLLNDSEIVVVVEWGGAVRHVLPEQRLRVEFTRTGDDSRQLIFEAPDPLAYLLEGVC